MLETTTLSPFGAIYVAVCDSVCCKKSENFMAVGGLEKEARRRVEYIERWGTTKVVNLLWLGYYSYLSISYLI